MPQPDCPAMLAELNQLNQQKMDLQSEIIDKQSEIITHQQDLYDLQSQLFTLMSQIAQKQQTYNMQCPS